MTPRTQFREAKRLKDATALLNLGSRLRTGFEVPRDLKLAKECFEEEMHLGRPRDGVDVEVALGRSAFRRALRSGR